MLHYRFCANGYCDSKGKRGEKTLKLDMKMKNVIPPNFYKCHVIGSVLCRSIYLHSTLTFQMFNSNYSVDHCL